MTRSTVPAALAPATPLVRSGTSIQLFIQTFTSDISALKSFYLLSFSPSRHSRLHEYLVKSLDTLESSFHFNKLTREDQVDYLLVQSHIKRQIHDGEDEADRFKKAHSLLGSWVRLLVEVVEDRQNVKKQSGNTVATKFTDAGTHLSEIVRCVEKDELEALGGGKKEKIVMTWTLRKVEELQKALQEAVDFYAGYDPTMTWWIEKPWKTLSTQLDVFAEILRDKTGVNGGGSVDDIVGQPIGRASLIRELEAEWIAYTPEELVGIADKEFEWCEREMELASQALGYGNPKDALEHVRNTYVQPGDQIHMVHDLATEAIEYVERHDLITVPQVAKECWRTTMMSPERQKVNPFFLGGERIIVSYPTNTMDHEDKLMIMRGNNPAFSRCTVHHELIPGHHLQFYYMDRYHPYRKLFMTPFWVEGWALYWEFLLWDLEFPAECAQKWARNEAENRIGMLFWRMHRCARIIFSIKFHLGQMTPKECIDLLVDRVGHERATAEGEVRRSFTGEYSPLYQAGYMLGALQLYRLKAELMDMEDSPHWSMKAFHDAVMRESAMPIELLRALLKGEGLSKDRKPGWRFYDTMI